MLIIKVKNKNIEAALKSYKYKVYKTKQLQEVWDNQEYTKNSVKKREEKKKAIYANNKRRDSE
jgi:small subunit ribosomal protein S21